MTASTPKDRERRFWLTTTAVAGGAGLTATAVPFVASMAPSERARAIGAPVSIDVQGMKAASSGPWRGAASRCSCSSARLRCWSHCHAITSCLPIRNPFSQFIPRTREHRPIDQTGARCAGGRLHAPGLHPNLSSNTGCARHRCQLAGGLLLPVPWLEVRSGRSGLQKRARADQSRDSALPLHFRHEFADRRRPRMSPPGRPKGPIPEREARGCLMNPLHAKRAPAP